MERRRAGVSARPGVPGPDRAGDMADTGIDAAGVARLDVRPFAIAPADEHHAITGGRIGERAGDAGWCDTDRDRSQRWRPGKGTLPGTDQRKAKKDRRASQPGRRHRAPRWHGTCSSGPGRVPAQKVQPPGRMVACRVRPCACIGARQPIRCLVQQRVGSRRTLPARPSAPPSTSTQVPVECRSSPRQGPLATVPPVIRSVLAPDRGRNL